MTASIFPCGQKKHTCIGIHVTLDSNKERKLRNGKETRREHLTKSIIKHNKYIDRVGGEGEGGDGEY